VGGILFVFALVWVLTLTFVLCGLSFRFAQGPQTICPFPIPFLPSPFSPFKPPQWGINRRAFFAVYLAKFRFSLCGLCGCSYNGF